MENSRDQRWNISVVSVRSNTNKKKGRATFTSRSWNWSDRCRWRRPASSSARASTATCTATRAASPSAASSTGSTTSKTTPSSTCRSSKSSKSNTRSVTQGLPVAVNSHRKRMTSITELVFGVLFLVNGFNYEVESRTETTCVARSDVDIDARDAVQFSLRFLFIKFGIRRPPIVLVLFVFFSSSSCARLSRVKYRARVYRNATAAWHAPCLTTESVDFVEMSSFTAFLSC